MNNKNRLHATLLSLLCILVFATAGHAAEPPLTRAPAWGVGMSYRTGQIPFQLPTDRVSTLVPLFYYQGERFFLEGDKGGMHLWQSEPGSTDNLFAARPMPAWQLDAHAQLRFTNIPKSWQNRQQADAVDVGLRLRHELDSHNWGSLGGYTDSDGHWYADATWGENWLLERWLLEPRLMARYKPARFNTRYYADVVGSDQQLAAGTELSAALESRWQLYANFYLLNKLAYTYLDAPVRHSAMVNHQGQAEAWLGFGLFESPHQMRQVSSLPKGSYLRLAHGWATPADIGEVLVLQNQPDPHDNQMSSIFYGHPLANELFGTPIELYLTPGFGWHWPSRVQSASQEYVMAFKGYYRFRWPTSWRLGLAEGISYVSNITWIENSEMIEKGYRPSHLMNYLDFSADTNLGELFGIPSLNPLWLGYSLHHRSAMFETSSEFGRIKGGSNYNSVYLQWQF